MSTRTLGLVHSVLAAVQTALTTDKDVDVAVLGDFIAGVTPLVGSGREPSDAELNALTQLGAAVTATGEEPADDFSEEALTAKAAEDHPSAPREGGDGGDAGEGQPSSDAVVTEPSAGEPAPAEPSAPVTNDALFSQQVDENDGA